ncbi:single-stranded DNA-binding protein [Gracilibacillus boraciitolerans JCM 21714]|uniref:Single-stranded DNA-binding protein n=1 Tax=Gracilibacillus boraciitolerans JCM 21714 TaxID=1298598 RepID=W4VJU1_9BACI|nr:single-stranded DNA-binding protein [Gracilibacillus boraciitolerans]GAE93093.1 single-stranded DNA-binding protein [Gracilibacillus boraciitolerans JCM 21714]
MLNVCNFVGRLGKDVELRYTPNGAAVANFSLALTEPIPDQNGERGVSFINVVAWQKTAENMANQLSKGDIIGITARVNVRNFEGNDGKKVYVTEFIVQGLPTFIKVKKWENGNGGNNQGNTNNQYQSQNQNTQNTNQSPFANAQPIAINDNDLPF